MKSWFGFFFFLPVFFLGSRSLRLLKPKAKRRRHAAQYSHTQPSRGLRLCARHFSPKQVKTHTNPFSPVSPRCCRRRRSPAKPIEIPWPSSFAEVPHSPSAPPLSPLPPPPCTASLLSDPSRAPRSSPPPSSSSSRPGEASRRGKNRVSCAPQATPFVDAVTRQLSSVWVFHSRSLGCR
jgi:hypothetical protein